MNRRPLAAGAATLVAVAACHRQHSATPAVASTVESHCWWTVMRSPLPVDTVVARFQRGFAGAGLTNVTIVRSADTVRAQAGPTPLGGTPAGAAYGMRLVAYPANDSTRFRYFATAVAPPSGWAQPSDTLAAEERFLPLCVQVAKSAAVKWSGPREPNGEELAAVWRPTP